MQAQAGQNKAVNTFPPSLAFSLILSSFQLEADAQCQHNEV
jgi:hypothetical protein